METARQFSGMPDMPRMPKVTFALSRKTKHFIAVLVVVSIILIVAGLNVPKAIDEQRLSAIENKTEVAFRMASNAYKVAYVPSVGGSSLQMVYMNDLDNYTKEDRFENITEGWLFYDWVNGTIGNFSTLIVRDNITGVMYTAMWNATNASYALNTTLATMAWNQTNTTYALNTTLAAMAWNSTNTTYALNSTLATMSWNTTNTTYMRNDIVNSIGNFTTLNVTGNVTFGNHKLEWWNGSAWYEMVVA